MPDVHRSWLLPGAGSWMHEPVFISAPVAAQQLQGCHDLVRQADDTLAQVSTWMCSPDTAAMTVTDRPHIALDATLLHECGMLYRAAALSKEPTHPRFVRRNGAALAVMVVGSRSIDP